MKNNPLRYWDPTGHQQIQDDGGRGGLPSPFGGSVGAPPKTVKRGTTPNRITIQPRTVFDVIEEEVLLIKSQAPRGGAGEGAGNPSTPKAGGKSKNNMKFDQNATGEHSTYKRDPETREITNWQRWNKSDPRNPNPFTPRERYDGKGAGHFNKQTGEMVETPHVNDPLTPGGVRKPYPWEIPGKP